MEAALNGVDMKVRVAAKERRGRTKGTGKEGGKTMRSQLHGARELLTRVGMACSWLGANNRRGLRGGD